MNNFQDRNTKILQDIHIWNNSQRIITILKIFQHIDMLKICVKNSHTIENIPMSSTLPSKTQINKAKIGTSFKPLQ